jgi:hypothetical protein
LNYREKERKVRIPITRTNFENVVWKNNSIFFSDVAEKIKVCPTVPHCLSFTRMQEAKEQRLKKVIF